MSLSKPLSTRFWALARLSLAGLAIACLFVGTAAAADTIGVGVGTGRIKLNEPLRPGLTYDLPSIAVFNSGDVTSGYEMTVQYNETQPELKPKASWVTFSPQKFTMRAGASQEVKITIKTDSATRPGKYFAYLEAHPIKIDTSGVTAIKIAAATKFSFEVAPANIWQRIYYAIQDFWNKYHNILIPILIVIGVVLLIFVAKRFFRIELRRKKRNFR